MASPYNIDEYLWYEVKYFPFSVIIAAIFGLYHTLKVLIENYCQAVDEVISCNPCLQNS